MDLDAIDARLTGPGGPFEIAEEWVLGEKMGVFKTRKGSLRELLAASAAHGDKEYIVHGDRRITFAEHADLVAAAAQGLRDRYDIRHGDRVAILAANCPEWLISFWAVTSMGAIAVALNGWWTRDEILYGIEHSEPKLLIADRKRLARIADDEVPCAVLEIESDFDTLLASAKDAVLPENPIAEDDPAVILYTSGTTGRPKGAVNSHRGICGFVQSASVGGLRLMIAAAEKGVEAEPNPPPICSLMTVPLFHLSGLYAGAVMMLAVGAKTVWRSGRFEPEDVLRLIEEERVTNWAGLGSMGPRVLTHPKIGEYDLSSIRNLGSGGAPTSPALLERMKEVAPQGARSRGIGYGLSESVTTVAVIGGEELEERPTSVGRVQPTHRVEIRGPEGQVLPEGSEGEIFVRSPYLMLEYWRDPVATKESLRPGRWLATGDIGHIEDGYLYINSRARELILRAAENIYPVEIENRLHSHPAVEEVAVVGVDHPELGQEVKAVVVAKAGTAPQQSELAAWVGETLAPYKVPSQWEIRSEPLPRNAAGKVLKNVLSGEVENRFVEE